MKTKYVLSFALLFAVATVSAFSQEQEANEEPAWAETLKDNIPRIVRWDNFSLFEAGLVQLDGTRLSRKESTALLESAPGNRDLLAQVRRDRIVSGVLMSIASAALITGVSLAIADVPYARDIVYPSTILAWAAGYGASISVMYTGHSRYLRAVDNYNLYVLGIPVAGPRN